MQKLFSFLQKSFNLIFLVQFLVCAFSTAEWTISITPQKVACIHAPQEALIFSNHYFSHYFKKHAQSLLQQEAVVNLKAAWTVEVLKTKQKTAGIFPSHPLSFSMNPT